MPTADDSAIRAPRKGALGDPREDWRRITGEPVDPRSWFRRVHPDDVGRIIHAVQFDRFCEEYRLLDSRNRYVWVRGEYVRLGPDDWRGSVTVIQRDDRPHLCTQDGCVCAVMFGTGFG